MPKAKGKSKYYDYKAKRRRRDATVERRDDDSNGKTSYTVRRWQKTSWSRTESVHSTRENPPMASLGPSSSSSTSSDGGTCSGLRRGHPELQKRKVKTTEQRSQKVPTAAKAKSDTSDGCSSSSLDIPGFYYDAEKKKYFKILPGHSNLNVVTRESITMKKAEEKRKEDMKEVGKNKHYLTKLDLDLAQHKRVKSGNFCHLFVGIHQGELTRSDLKENVLKSQIRKLKPFKSTKVFSNPFGTYENLEHMLLMDTTPNCCDILGLWSIKETLVHRIQLLHVDVKKPSSLSSEERKRRGLNIDISPCGNVVLQSLNKITHACWAPSVENPSRKYILYTTMCYTGHSPSLALFRNLEPSSREDFHATDFCLGQKATWTCAWNPHRQQFSVGTEKSGLLLHVETRRLWELFSNNSDVLAQVFTASDGGQSLISGTRKGEIITHDLRSRSTYPVRALYQRSPISSLKLMPDEVYLLASDFSGAIKLWDLRMRGCVQDFRGHCNHYSRLPLHVDSEQQILYTVGDDSYTRFWHLKSGEMLASLPPPDPASRDYLPCVLHSQQWGGQWGQTGLIMATGSKLHLYHSADYDT